MARRKTYHLVCDRCAEVFTPRSSFPPGPTTPERLLVPNLLADVLAQAADIGWFVLYGLNIDVCATCREGFDAPTTESTP